MARDWGQAAGAAEGTARDLQRVLEAEGGEQPDPGSLALDQRIGGHRGAVGEAHGGGQQIGEGYLFGRGQLVEHGAHRLFGARRCGKRFLHAQPAGTAQLHQVGEGAAGIDAEEADGRD
jgi:hypothetical protein